jgi:hypothetical protein
MKRNKIASMPPEGSKYCSYPATDDLIKDGYAKIKAWMADV